MSGKKKKDPKEKLSKDIISLRDKLLAKAAEKDKESIHMACKGMYKCDKLADENCLKGIMGKLEKLSGDKPSDKKEKKPAKKAK